MNRTKRAAALFAVTGSLVLATTGIAAADSATSTGGCATATSANGNSAMAGSCGTSTTPPASTPAPAAMPNCLVTIVSGVVADPVKAITGALADPVGTVGAVVTCVVSLL